MRSSVDTAEKKKKLSYQTGSGVKREKRKSLPETNFFFSTASVETPKEKKKAKREIDVCWATKLDDKWIEFISYPVAMQSWAAERVEGLERELGIEWNFNLIKTKIKVVLIVQTAGKCLASH